MSVESNEVKFYKSKNCQGTPVSYKEGASVAFTPNDPDNDKYLSCIVGTNIWVNAYQHNDAFNPEAGAHENLTAGTHNDLSSLKGLSKFQVLGNEFGYAIDVKLTDKTVPKLADGGYEFTIIPYQVEEVKCVTGDDYKQCAIPQLTPPDSEIVCQIVCRATAWPGAVVANGSVYFKYTPTTGLITFRKTEGFPTNMSIVQEGMTNFNFSIDTIPAQ
eukprot:gene7843-9204_t